MLLEIQIAIACKEKLYLAQQRVETWPTVCAQLGSPEEPNGCISQYSQGFLLFRE